LKTKAQPLTFELYKSEKDFLDITVPKSLL